MNVGTGVAPASQEVPRSEQVARDTDAMSDVNDRSSTTVEAVTVDLGIGFPATRGDNSDAPRRPRAYSNLQLALSRPHEELGVIIASHATLCVDADIVSGTLTELGAQLLLVREGQDALVPRDASGTFRLWLSNGRVTRYELKLRGAIDVASRAGVRRLEVTQTSETVIRSAPVTTLEVPEAARARLGG